MRYFDLFAVARRLLTLSFVVSALHVLSVCRLLAICCFELHEKSMRDGCGHACHDPGPPRLSDFRHAAAQVA
jgi:hypothetical protein